MKVVIDTVNNSLSVQGQDGNKDLDFYGKEAFEIISDLWLKTGWNQKYSYTFTWLGRPVIQHPEDMLRLQEVIYNLKPDVIVETGVAHGGSLIFYAHILQTIGKGKVIGVDIDIRSHNRRAIEEHELAPFITLIQGDSASPEVIAQVESHIKPDGTVLVLLDSDHSKGHVARELEAYHHLVSPGSYIVATDGIMQMVHDVPLAKPSWKEDNPVAAVEEFLVKHPEFSEETPAWMFNESALDKNITAWPSAWLRRRR